MKQFSEATRVQMPAMVHLTRIGYTYFGKLSEDKNGTVYDGDTNILLSVFEQQFKKLNPGHKGEYLQVLKDIRKELNDDDLGRGFYNRLKAVSPVKLIDFDNVENNTFHFTAEFTCKNGQDEFRPDITLFVNGLPLCFVEVKKPNNHGGMLVESTRVNKERFPNKKFRRFINITQLMIFSNNMEYDALGGIVPIQGAFYCTGARSYSPFNCFREENQSSQKIAPFYQNYPYKEIDKDVEKQILSDYNCQEKTLNLIDGLKATCQSYGMGNDGNEYKIITQVFLCKFLNDKFGYELKNAKSGIENKILHKIVDDKIVYGCVSMPSNVFANTGTNVSVLFFDKSATTDKVILIDASKLGEEYKDNGLKKVRLNDDEIEKIVGTFQRKEAVDDFSVAVSYDEIKEKGYSLSAGQYFDIKIDYVDITEEEFNKRMTEYKQTLSEQFAESHRLEEEIMKQLDALRFNANVGDNE